MGFLENSRNFEVFFLDSEVIPGVFDHLESLNERVFESWKLTPYLTAKHQWEGVEDSERPNLQHYTAC